MRFGVGDKVRILDRPVVNTCYWNEVGVVVDVYIEWKQEYIKVKIDNNDYPLALWPNEIEIVG